MGQYEYWHKKCMRKLIDSQWKGMRVERRNRSKDFSLTRGIVFFRVKFHFHHISHPNQEPVQWCHRTWGKSSGFHYFMLCIFCGMWHDVICPGGRERYFPDFVFPFHHLLPPASSYSSIIHLSLSPHQKMPCKNSGPDVTPEPNNVTLLNQPEIYKTNIKSFTIPLF